MGGYLGKSVGGFTSVTEKRQTFNITTTTTQLTGLSYTPTKEEVHVNGIRYVRDIDYTANDGLTVTMTNPLLNGDTAIVSSFPSFDVADTVSASNGGTFAGNVAMSGNSTVGGTLGVTGNTTAGGTLDVTGAATMSGNLGVGTSPTVPLQVEKAAGADWLARFQNTTSATPYGVNIYDASSASNGYPLLQVTNSAGSGSYFRVDSGTGYVTKPKVPSFMHASYMSYTVPSATTANFTNSNVFSANNAGLYENGDSGWDFTTGVFTAPVAGRYFFSFSYTLSSFSSGYFWVYLQVNAVSKTYNQNPQSSALTPVTNSMVVELAANDAVRVVFTNNYSGMVVNYANFHGFLIG